MNFDQETLLTAYLDNELPPDLREGVASAVASDPRLADDLRALRVLGELVASLPRPAPMVDISVAVLAGIGRRPLRRGHRDILGFWPSASSAPVRVLGLAASAAAVVALLTLAITRPGPRHGPPSVVLRPVAPAPVSVPVSVPVLNPAPPPAVVVEHKNPSADARPAVVTEPRHAEAQRNVRRLLDSPALHKVFVVTDVLDGGANRQVGEILDRSPRRHAPFGRITVTQGIVLDPALPGSATVYVVVMDDRELGELRDKLNRVFPANLQENAPRPEVVARLAEVGQVAMLPGTPVSELLEDRVLERQRAIPEFRKPALAPRSMVVLPPGFDTDPLLDPRLIQNVTTDAADAAEPTIERFRSGPHPSVSARARAEKLANNPPIAPKAPAPVPASVLAQSPSRPIHVVLVWIAPPAGIEGL